LELLFSVKPSTQQPTTPFIAFNGHHWATRLQRYFIANLKFHILSSFA